jgi:hypothetical protein
MTTQARPEPPIHLDGRHRRTFDEIFRHPASHNLEWHDVRSLLDALGDVTEKQNGSIDVTRNGQHINLHAPKHKDIASLEDLMAIRHFLERSDEGESPSPASNGTDVVVVIDHHEAKIYRSDLHGTVPERIVPDDPHGFGRHLQSENPETDGKRQPERKSYYEGVAATLRGANRILIFGTGTGESSAMDRLLAELKHNHVDGAGHVVGSIAVDEKHLTEGQLLAKARDFFASKVG